MRFFKHFFAVLAVAAMTVFAGMSGELSPELETVKSACAADATVQCACVKSLGKTCNPDSGPTEVNWECNDDAIMIQ